MAQECDVLIIGAGPVGLMLALLLRKQGIHCRIIDKMIERQSYCKALGIQPRTLEVWDDIGMLNPVINEGLCFKETRIFQDGKEIHSNQIELPELPFGFLSIPQFKLEDILVNEVQELGLVVEQGIELISFEQTDNGVVAVLKNNKTEALDKVHLKYLVGCDGAHSQTRKLLDLKFEGGKLPQYFMLADVRVNWVYAHQVNYRFGYNHDGIENTVVFVPYRGDRRFRISTSVPESMLAKIKDGKPTLEQFSSVIEKAVPVKVKIDDLRWSSMYQISHRIVNQYASGRIFLAGDAAHIHPPVGGQGMNTGLQDVYNLAWKLALVLKNRAKVLLLDTYNEERYPVGLDVVNRTHKQMQAKNSAVSDAHYALLVNSQTLINYQESSLSKGQSLSLDGCKPGDRAPDVSILKRDIFNFPIRLFEILRGHKFKLLMYTDGSMEKQPLDDFLDAGQKLQNHFSFLLETYLIGSPEFHLSENSTLTLLSDLDNNFKSTYKMKPGSACLIRPDNYITYHCEVLNEHELVNYLQEVGMVI